MGYRKRKSQAEPGILDVVLEISQKAPLMGVGFGVATLLAAAYIAWGTPNAMMGFAPIIGMCVAMFGVLCLIASGIGFLRRPRRSVLNVGAWSMDAVRDLSWQEFERLVADLFRRQGYRVEETGRDAQVAGTGDGGVDLIFSHPNSPGAKYLVQCKQYRAWDVGEPKVREFFGAMAAWKTNCEGIIVTCGRYTQKAKDFALGKPIRLIDGDGLLRMLNEINPNAPAVTTVAPVVVQQASVPVTPIPHATSPRCPKCGSTMVRRVAGRGLRQGKPLWGCSTFPRCKGIIDINE